jgi:eukaryotic-like serine/threonine-protein kinase
VLDEHLETTRCDDHAACVAGRYHLGPVLRRSAGCCAHRAYDELLQRTVSLTLVTAERDASSPFSLGPQCWRDRGPEVAELYDAGSEGDRLFLVTQHPDQPTLAETTPPGGLDAAAIRELGSAVAGALLPRHQHGAVHGGLGAGTVAWSPHGTSLADFGLLPWLARWGELPVAPPFPAPEQGAGTPTGPATDVYALGRLLGELAPERGLRPGLRTLIADMTAESPTARPTLDEVLQRLRTMPAAAPFRSAGRLARTTVARHGRRVALAAAACAVVGLGAGLAAAGSAPAAPSATLAATAPAAAPPFALNIQLPGDAPGPADPATPSSGSADTAAAATSSSGSSSSGSSSSADSSAAGSSGVTEAADRTTTADRTSASGDHGSTADHADTTPSPVANDQATSDDTSSSRTQAPATHASRSQHHPSGLAGFLTSVGGHDRGGDAKQDDSKQDDSKQDSTEQAGATKAAPPHHGGSSKHDDGGDDLLDALSP